MQTNTEFCLRRPIVDFGGVWSGFVELRELRVTRLEEGTILRARFRVVGLSPIGGATRLVDVITTGSDCGVG